jgi:hypothetical protein
VWSLFGEYPRLKDLPNIKDNAKKEEEIFSEAKIMQGSACYHRVPSIRVTWLITSHLHMTEHLFISSSYVFYFE